MNFVGFAWDHGKLMDHLFTTVTDIMRLILPMLDIHKNNREQI
jgi:hypothetical protein